MLVVRGRKRLLSQGGAVMRYSSPVSIRDTSAVSASPPIGRQDAQDAERDGATRFTRLKIRGACQRVQARFWRARRK
jgi:hypothetical protein